MRVDPAFFYHPDLAALGMTDPEAAARIVIASAQQAGVNTLFLRAYDPAHGAFYPTAVPHAAVEPELGKKDVFGAVTRAATDARIAVVAWLPVNEFASVAAAEPGWRMPNSRLSGTSSAYRAWYETFLLDLVTRYPALSGLDAAEASIDDKWVSPPSANERDGLTALHDILVTTARSANKRAFITQTVTASCDGGLLDASVVRDGSGFDANAVLGRFFARSPVTFVGQVLWQQWAATCPGSTFDAAWTTRAVNALSRRVPFGATSVAHVELSPFGSVAPSLADFETALRAATASRGGADFYDFHLAKLHGALEVAGRVYRSRRGCSE